MKNPQELLNGLRQFSGTTQWYKNPLFPNCIYTDGIKYLAEHAECYWLLDFIFSNQMLKVIKAEEFQVWTLKKDGIKAIITVGDGNDNIVKTFKIPYTTFPLEEYTLWMIQGRLILKSEY